MNRHRCSSGELYAWGDRLPLLPLVGLKRLLPSITISLWGLIGAFIVGWVGWFYLTAPVGQRPSELVVIDAAVAHPHRLIAQLKPHQHAVFLKAHAPDSLIELTQILTRYRNLKAIHLISHGSPGQLQLGQMGVNTAALVVHRSQLRQWQQAMTPKADILIYGCDVAIDDVGLTFLQTLRQFTHADIAASSNLTGSPQLKGDWQLEVHLGQLETPVALSDDTVSDYDAVLKQISVTTTADAGVGSLRWAIAQANELPTDDLIDLSRVQGAIALQSPLPAITSNLFLVGNGDDTIRGSGKYRALEVDGGDVTIRNLTLADGLAQGTDGIDGAGGSAGMGGGLLIRRGTVQLSQVEFVNNQAMGGSGSQQPPAQIQIQHEKTRFKANRGAIIGINGASFSAHPLAKPPLTVDISSTNEKMKANRGAIAGVNGIGINGIGAIAFGGGGGFGGFGNAGNGGNGGNAGVNGGNGGDGGNGGNGGVGIFGTIAPRDDQNSIGAIAFGGGGGFGGFGNAGNGGNGGNATTDVADGGHGGNGGDGGNGGNGGGGGAGGIPGHAGRTGLGGFGGGDGGVGYSGSGGGLGGAVFIRSGSLILHQVRFIGNAAIAGSGVSPGQGKGGALFITSNRMGDQSSPEASSRVLVLGDPPEFIDNIASDAAGVPTDNNDIYGVLIKSPSRI